MKNNNYQSHRSISSFQDFVIERKKLRLKKKLIETRLQFNARELKEMMSLEKGFSLDIIQGLLQKFSGITRIIFNSGTGDQPDDSTEPGDQR